MNFKDACRIKFEKGKLEHNQPWDSHSINAPEEIKGELCDLANYSELLGDKELAVQIRMFAEEIYNRL